MADFFSGGGFDEASFNEASPNEVPATLQPPATVVDLVQQFTNALTITSRMVNSVSLS
jgi:hypothetical protein